MTERIVVGTVNGYAITVRDDYTTADVRLEAEGKSWYIGTASTQWGVRRLLTKARKKALQFNVPSESNWIRSAISIWNERKR